MGTWTIISNFWKFYLIKTGFTLLEPVLLVKVFRLFRLEWIFSGVQSVDKVCRCTTLHIVKDVVDEMKLSTHPWMASYNNPLQCEG